MRYLFSCIIYLILICINHPLFSQSFLVNGGANSFSLSDANVCISDTYSPINNPAGIATLKYRSLSVSSKILYTDTDLKTHYFSTILPLKKFAISLSIINHGNSYLNQQKAGVAIANKIGFVKLGFQAGYYQLKAEGFGSAGQLVFDFGGIAELSEKLSFGAHIFNFTQSSLKNGETIPIIMKAGIKYAPISVFRIFLEVEKELYSEPLFKTGISYEMVSNLYIQTGITVNPSKNFFGLHYKGKKIGFGYALSYHQFLGMIHQATLEYKIRKK